MIGIVGEKSGDKGGGTLVGDTWESSINPRKLVVTDRN